MGRGVPVFRDLFNADLGLRPVSPRVTWALESRLLRALSPTKLLWDTTYNANINANNNNGYRDGPSGRSHIIDIVSSADYALCASVASNGCVSVHEPSDLDAANTWRLSLRLPGATCATWGGSSASDSVYVALSQRSSVWRFDLEACSEDKPSHELHFPVANNGGSANKQVHASDIVTLAPHVLAATTSQGRAIVLDERQKRCAVGRMQVSQYSGTSSRPPPITGAGSFIVVGTQGHLAMYDIRKFPAVSYSSSVAVGATTHTFGAAKRRRTEPATPAFLRGAFSTVRVLDTSNRGTGGDFDTVHVAPGSRTTVAFQLSSGHVGIADLMRKGTSGVRVKVESTVPKRVVPPPRAAGGTGYAAVAGELVEYGATMRSVVDIWWVMRRRASLLSPAYQDSPRAAWRFYAPLVNRAGFRVLALHPDLKTEVVGVKTGTKSVSCVKALYAPGGAPVVGVGYTHMHAELFEPGIRRDEKSDEENQ